jgi:hypothetical protein
MPYALLLPLVTLCCVGAALLVLYLIRRFLGQWRSSADAAVTGGVAAMVLTLFALLLAFGIVTLYDEHRAAASAVAREASDLAQVRRATRVLEEQGVQPQRSVTAPIHNYVCDLEESEFEDMRNGRPIEKATIDDLNSIFTALSTYRPAEQAQTPFYASAVSQLNDAVAQRRERLERVNNVLPFAFALLLALTAMISVVLTCFIKTTGLSRHGTPHAGIEYVLVGSVAFVVAAGLLTALIFEFPFSGPLAISDHPFRTVRGC